MYCYAAALTALLSGQARAVDAGMWETEGSGDAEGGPEIGEGSEEVLHVEAALSESDEEAERKAELEAEEEAAAAEAQRSPEEV